MESMNKIVSRTDNVNFTTEKNAEEGAKMISRFHALVNLSKFALCSEPERANAVQRIKYALRNYECTDGQRMVLQGVMSILEIKPDNVMPVKRDNMTKIFCLKDFGTGDAIFFQTLEGVATFINAKNPIGGTLEVRDRATAGTYQIEPSTLDSLLQATQQYSGHMVLSFFVKVDFVFTQIESQYILSTVDVYD